MSVQEAGAHQAGRNGWAFQPGALLEEEVDSHSRRRCHGRSVAQVGRHETAFLECSVHCPHSLLHSEEIPGGYGGEPVPCESFPLAHSATSPLPGQTRDCIGSYLNCQMPRNLSRHVGEAPWGGVHVRQSPTSPRGPTWGQIGRRCDRLPWTGPWRNGSPSPSRKVTWTSSC